LNESVISPKGSITNPPLPPSDKKIQEKPVETPKNGIFAQFTGKSTLGIKIVI